MRELHAGGDLRPTVPRIVDREGVSLRTVWQQFADREELLAEAVRRDLEILLSLVRKIEPDQPLPTRIGSFVGQRARILEEMTPSWRAARIQEPFSGQLSGNKARMLARARVELEKVFGPELARLSGQDRQQLLDALHAVSVWEFWESLRADLGLSLRQARGVVSATFTALFAQAGVR